MRKGFLFSLIIIAMLSATISPACAFIFGKSGDYIEICSGLKLIKIQTDNNEIPDVAGDDCPFCFHKNMAAIHNDIDDFGEIISPNHFQGFVNETALLRFVKPYQSRAPPMLS